MRGSIPVYWRQETSATNPKPPIIIQRQDPTYKMTTLHFQDLFSRYATPIICLDLVRQQETTPREMKVSIIHKKKLV